MEDTYKFHYANMSNSSHYSGWSKRLPLEFTNSAVQNSGAKLYFNPLIPLRSLKEIDRQDVRRLKYGIISKENALNDLLHWESFALAGRT